MMIDARRFAARFGGGLLACVLAVGCADPGRDRAARFSEAQIAYDRRQYARATEQLNAYIEHAPKKDDLGDALYLRALAHVGAGRRADAYADLQRCVQVTRNADSRWRAEIVLGTLHFEDANWEQARRAYAAAADAMPKSPPLDTALLRLALSEERLNRWGDALRTYERLLSVFGSGPAADHARQRLALRPTHFAVQCGAFSRPENAEKLRFSLRAAGLEAYVNRESRGNGAPLHVVLVGRYTSYAEASAALERVRREAPSAILWP